MARRRINFDSLDEDSQSKNTNEKPILADIKNWSYLDADRNLRNIYKKYGLMQYFLYCILYFLILDKKSMNFSDFPSIMLMFSFIIGLIGTLICGYIIIVCIIGILYLLC